MGGQLPSSALVVMEFEVMIMVDFDFQFQGHKVFLRLSFLA